MLKKSIFACLLGLFTGTLQAKVVLPAFFTDNMVLQQQSKVTFFGTAEKNKSVTVKTGWSGKTFRTQADANGKWSIEVKTPQAGGPYNICFSDGKELELKNVLLGEVWLCSGQSNMEMPVAGWGKVMNYEQEIKEADYPSIRLFQVKKATALSPKENLESTMGGWQECSSKTVPEFSALAYFYARQLWENLNVPVGVIDCTWGGTPAEAWTSLQTVSRVMGLEQVGKAFADAGYDEQKIIVNYNKVYQAWYERFIAADKGLDRGTPVWSDTEYDDAEWKEMALPALWEKEKLPNFDGIVWFRKQIQIPQDWANKDLTLSLGMIDDEDIVYLNGEEVASGAGFNTSRIYTIPAEKVKVGTSLLTVRVSDTGGEGGIYGNADAFYMNVKGKTPKSLVGVWKYRVGMDLKEVGPAPVSPFGSSSYPTVLYNAMVHPLTALPIKGVIWYQGEANVRRAVQYESLFQGLIQDWRQSFRSPEMPFYFVQLANFLERKTVQPDSEWAALREAQDKALHLDGTAMATIIDIGEAEDIHPKNKQEVGRRLALCALANTYGKNNVTASAPRYENYRIQGDKVYLYFDEVNGGFDKNRELKGFIMAGPDHCFYEAKAYVEGNCIVVECPEVKLPVAVRYGWADNPECTLFGASGLPVAPFRTDNWN
jgi:sialic acid-specific 9-O-acetylesterase